MLSRKNGSFSNVDLSNLIPVLLIAFFAAAGAVSAAQTPVTGEKTDLRVVAPESGSVSFSTWQESGRRYTSVSKNGGKTWSTPRAMIDEIPLQAGVIVPDEYMPAVPKNLAAGEENRVFIVQFETQSLAEWRRQLRELGAEVLNYVPYNAHLVRMDPDLVSDVEAKPFVRWVGPYEPSFRTFPELLAELDAQNVLTRRYNVMTYTPGETEKSILATEVEGIGGQVVAAIPDGYILEAALTDAQVLTLLASNHVQWIDLWGAFEEDMDQGRVVAGADYVAATPGAYDGTGVRAEVMDGGIDTVHSDLPNPIPIHGNVNSSGTSHGTCTYGINFSPGTTRPEVTGMAPMAYGYFAYYAALTNRYTHTAELVNPALPYQCVYQSNSWGSTRTRAYTSISHEMDAIIWQSDITIFQSQSNAGNQDSRPQAWAKNVIAVGGAYHYNTADPANDRWNFGASTGPAADGRIKPDLTFWYDWIMTTDAEPGGYVSGNEVTTTFGGTSGATPMAAGTSALFFQMWADDVWGTSPNAGTVFEDRPHFSTMKALLVNTANQYDWTTPNNTDLTRFRQGWGYPDAETAYDRAALTQVIDETSVLSELESDIYTATVPASQGELKVTMVYADRAGTTSSTLHRINDVTLRATAPDGTVYWGNNGLTSGIWSTPGGGGDAINTVENVFIPSPMEGDWSIEVIAYEVNMDVHVETPEDDQDYALVVYGVTGMTAAPGGLIFVDGFEAGDADRWSRVEP